MKTMVKVCRRGLARYGWKDIRS